MKSEIIYKLLNSLLIVTKILISSFFFRINSYDLCYYNFHIIYIFKNDES